MSNKNTFATIDNADLEQWRITSRKLLSEFSAVDAPTRLASFPVEVES